VQAKHTQNWRITVARLEQCFYLSRAAQQLTRFEVQQILHISRRNNRQRDITGCLLYTGAHFAQILEGEHAALETLLGRIAQDPRHENLVVTMTRDIDIRRFPDWSMGLLYKSETADRIEALLSCALLPEAEADRLFEEVNPDSVMGSL
jgi:hypothetical protein